MLKRFLISSLLCLFISPALHAGDPVAGKAVAQNCVICHGEEGISPNSEIPNLAGQLAPYITQRLEDLRHERNKDNLMYSVAVLISDPKMVADVAAYYESLPAAEYRIMDQELANYGKEVYFGLSSCFACHGEDARGTISQEGYASPRLASLSREFLIKSMYEFRSRTRTSDKGYMMNNVLERTPDYDIKALAEYLSTRE